MCILLTLYVEVYDSKFGLLAKKCSYYTTGRYPYVEVEPTLYTYLNRFVYVRAVYTKLVGEADEVDDTKEIAVVVVEIGVSLLTYRLYAIYALLTNLV